MALLAGGAVAATGLAWFAACWVGAPEAVLPAVAIAVVVGSGCGVAALGAVAALGPGESVDGGSAEAPAATVGGAT